MMRLPIIVLALAMWTWPVSTFAQVGADTGVAASFEQLQVLLRPGDTVGLTDASFSTVSGRIDSLTSSTLSLVVNGIRRDLERSDVTAIWAPRTDSLADGARRGFRIGAVLGVLSVLACMGECGSTVGDAAMNAATFAALGAGIGVGMDARNRETKDHLIYRRPAVSGARLSITPPQAGMTMSVRF
jgi:hypothetical protein